MSYAGRAELERDWTIAAGPPSFSRRGWSRGSDCHRQPRHDKRTLAVRMDVQAAAQLPESFSHAPDSNAGSARRG